MARQYFAGSGAYWEHTAEAEGAQVPKQSADATVFGAWVFQGDADASELVTTDAGAYDYHSYSTHPASPKPWGIASSAAVVASWTAPENATSAALGAGVGVNAGTVTGALYGTAEITITKNGATVASFDPATTPWNGDPYGAPAAAWSGAVVPGDVLAISITPPDPSYVQPKRLVVFGGYWELSADFCQISVDPAARTVESEAQTGLTVSVTADADCAWTATADDAWITVTGGAAGTGTGSAQTTTYGVTKNETGEARVGTITFATEDDTATHTVTQEPCDAVTVVYFSIVGAPNQNRTRRQDGYEHAQDAPASVWTIPHGLGKRPAVTVIDNDGNVLTGTVAHPTPDTTTITFGSARTGTAYLS